MWLTLDVNSTANQGTNEGNDKAYAGFVVNATPNQYADLTIPTLTLGSTSGPAGSSTAVNFTIANTGAGASVATTANIRVSNSATAPSTSDMLLGTVDVNTLAAGQSQSFSPTYNPTAVDGAVTISGLQPGDTVTWETGGVG